MNCIIWSYCKSLTFAFFWIVNHGYPRINQIINKLKTAVQNIYHHTEEKEKLVGMRSELENDIKRYNDELHDLELRKELCELEVSDKVKI